MIFLFKKSNSIITVAAVTIFDSSSLETYSVYSSSPMHPPVNEVCGGFMCVRGKSRLCHVSVFLIFMYTPKNCKKPGFVEFSLITVMVLCVGVVTYIVPLIIKLSNNYQEREREV